MVESAIIDWDEHGAPRSRKFDDIYYSRDGGLAESDAVFLKGCDLPAAWAGRDRFVVGELGFGTGLNILALLDLWRRTRPPAGRLHIFSLEAYPPTRDAARRALAAFPEVADLAERLLRAWPGARGVHRLDFPDLGAVLDLAVMEAAEALRGWDGLADAWFLDGFSPAKNPQMWRAEVLELVAERSAPDARLATFTVAGAVRRTLQAQGFAIAKRPGFGAKGERLEGRLDRPATGARARRDPGRICIIGAGVAGAALTRAFRSIGQDPLLIDAEGVGAGASGNPAALVTPRLDAGGGAGAQLHAQAFRRAQDVYGRDAPHCVIARGAVQLEATDRDASRFDRVARSDLFEVDAFTRLTPVDAGSRLGEATCVGGLWLKDALVIEPAAALAALIGDCPVRIAQVGRLEAAASGWRILAPDGAVICEADTVCIAAGFDSGSLAADLALQAIRGQATTARADSAPTAASWGGYLIPTREGLLFGATHDRDDSVQGVRAEDDARNLEMLGRARPALAAALSGGTLGARAGVRAAAQDHHSIAGALAGGEGLYGLTGLGGRGFVLAPLLAEHIAALATGAPSPLPLALSRIVRPERFSLGSGSR